MEVEIRDITHENLRDLFLPCRGCLYWERGEALEFLPMEEWEKLKEEWFIYTLHSIGPIAKLLYFNGLPVAYCQFTPPDPGLIPGLQNYLELFTLPDDSLFITCLYVKKPFRGRGFATRLLKKIIEDCRKREFRKIITIARDDSIENPSGPTSFYIKNGFTIVEKKKIGDMTFSLVSHPL